MKATGIVRRVDDLGRVVIPKEIRRTMRIREGDPLEIYTDNGCVVFKKYSPMGELDHITKPVIDALRNTIQLHIALVDRFGETVYHTFSKDVKELYIEELDEYLDDTAFQRVNIQVNNDYDCTYIAPVITDGEILGFVLVFNQESDSEQDEDFDFIRMTCQCLSGLLRE